VPTLQIETPSIEATTKGSTAEILSNLMLVTQNTKSINYLSLLALSIPGGFTKGVLPIGMQLIRNLFAEEKLLQIGNAFQKVTKWHQQFPKIAVLNN
jgi:aspartyl-tRNA(Asn)/glutamyl-tRNA(Gln) amidotransferase subunit A